MLKKFFVILMSSLLLISNLYADYSAMASGYSCPNGGTLDSSTGTCLNSTWSGGTFSSYTCSTGTLSGNQCVTTTPANQTYHYHFKACYMWFCQVWDYADLNSMWIAGWILVMNGGWIGNLYSGGGCWSGWPYPCGEQYPYSYSCPVGVLSGSNCLVTTPAQPLYNYPATAVYNCPWGGTLSGTICLSNLSCTTTYTNMTTSGTLYKTTPLTFKETINPAQPANLFCDNTPMPVLPTPIQQNNVDYKTSVNQY